MLALGGIILRMEKNNEVPPDPNNEPNSEPEATVGQFVVDADGDPIGAGGNKLPRVFPDIPCLRCNQHGRCIQSEYCLGPTAPEPTRTAGGSADKGTPTQGKGDPSAPRRKVGESYIEGGGGIRRVRRGIHAGVVKTDNVITSLAAGIEALQRAENILGPIGAETHQNSAVLEAVNSTNEALEHATNAGRLAVAAFDSLRAYSESLYH